ncbi:MAG: PaaI family thioesterase [Pseudomonadales bacterium]|nr:PaaI family thioesterase [Pseudomonadales bacterium]
MNMPDGYITDPGFDPAEDHIGPFYYRKEDENYRFAFVAEERHCNAQDMVHGGVLMTFADYCLCVEATDNYKDESCVTVSFNCEFLSAGKIGDLIECRADVTRKTGSMAFVRGDVYTGDDLIFTFSAVVKRLRKE